MTCVGILVPLTSELATLLPTRLKQAEIYRMNASTLVCLSGMGQEASAKAAATLLDAGATHLLNWGCSGALSPHLKSGFVIIPPAIVYGGEYYGCDPFWQLRLVSLLKGHLGLDAEGLLFSSTQVMVDGASKKRVRDEDKNVIAVDMECGAMAKIARDRGIPFVAIRSVADGADHTIPEWITGALGPTGEVHALKLLGGLLRSPWHLASLIQLGYRFGLAAHSLKRVAGILEDAAWCHIDTEKEGLPPTVTG